MKRMVVGFLFDAELKGVILVKKNRPDWQVGFLNGPGGHIEAGENMFGAMAREFKEETGAEVENWTHTVRLGGSDWEVDFFFASNQEAFETVRTVTDEEVVCVWIDDLQNQDLLPNLRWLIPLQLDVTVQFPVVLRSL